MANVVVGARSASRALRVAGTSARHLLPVAHRRRDRAAVAAAAARAAHALGSTYVKFGQMVASSPGLVGDDVATAFRGCLDTGPAVRRRAILRAVERAAGRPWSEAYDAIDPEPIGRASIAVVHRAVTAIGVPVVVKVQRPGVARRVRTDLHLLRTIAMAGVRFGKSADAAQALDLIDDLGRNLESELDFRMERSAMERIGARLAAYGVDSLVVPVPVTDLSDDTVLVMDDVSGVPVDDVDGIAALDVDAGPLVDDAIRAWLLTSLGDGDFHADYHAGNLLVRPDGRLAVIDWGIVGTLDEAGRHCLVRLLDAALGEDDGWTDVGDYFVSLFGDAVLQEIGATRAELPGVLAKLLGPLLRSPFGESGLADFLEAAKRRSDESAAAAGGDALVAVLEQKEQATPEMVSAHGFFLWMKQLVYLERYARLHRRHRSIAEHAAEVLPLVRRSLP